MKGLYAAFIATDARKADEYDVAPKAVSSRVTASMHPIAPSVMHRHRVHDQCIDSSKGIELPGNALNYPILS